MVIGDRPLDELLPLYRDPRSEMPVTQFDYEDAEKAGLVKFDFLGLKTLTVIAKAEELLKRRGIELDTQNIDFDDRATFDMLARGDSVGVFQLEGAGMRDLMRKMKPDHINDLVALVALYRPGPMDSIPKYIACKNGKEAPEYLHPSLEPILKETYGVMTYQEDVMRIARELAGYTMGAGRLLRRAMGKKIASEMAKHRDHFIKGAGEQGILPSVAEQIFEQAAKFAGYGFNKGHAAAYAQVAYQTAYLKANYPVEFLAASMTLDIGNTDRLNIFRQEAQRLGVKVLPPDINRSEALFRLRRRRGRGLLCAGRGQGRGPPGDGACRGSAPRGRPVQERRPISPARVDPKLVNKRAFENLARAGAFDALNTNRRQMVENSDRILGGAQARARGTRKRAGQSVRRPAQARRNCAWPRCPTGRRTNGWAKNSAPWAFISPAIRSTITASALTRLQAVSYAALMEDRRSGFAADAGGHRDQEIRTAQPQRPDVCLCLASPIPPACTR